MISRVIAEFGSPEAAELAVSRIKTSVDYVYSGNIMYTGGSTKKHTLGRGINYAVMPNSFSSSIGIAESEPFAEFNRHGKRTTACIICGSGAVENVISAMNAMGGTNIRSAV